MILLPWERYMVENLGSNRSVVILRPFTRRLYRGKSRFVRIDIVDTVLGKEVYIDGILQSSTHDEFIYHEALVHSLLSRLEARKVLIIGGGEGATAREVLRHPVERVDMVDIDGEFVEVVSKYVPEMAAGAYEDPRLILHIEDGWEFLEKAEGRWDAVIVDITEPEGPALRLYTREFFEMIREKGGAMSMFGGEVDGILEGGYQHRLISTIRSVFPWVKVGMVYVPSFLSSVFVVLAADAPLGDPGRIPPGLRYYDEETDRRMFSLPLYVRKALEKREPPYTLRELPKY